MNGLTKTVANLYNSIEPDIKITSAVSKHFEVNDSLLKKINSVKGVKLISQTISDKALLKNVDKQTLVSVKGVDVNFQQITGLDTTLVEGTYLLNDTSKRSIILGRGIANQLDVNTNVFVNELSLFSPVRGKSNSLNIDDQINQIYCEPSGIFSLNDELDFQFVFVSLKTASQLFDLPNKITAIEIACEKNKSEEVKEKLIEVLGEKFSVKNRYELNDVLFKSLETEKLATFIILAFILLIATFNIIGALTMLIIEKRKDIKTLFSMGANLATIRNIFMREAFLISGIGAFLGLLIGLVVCWTQMQFHWIGFGSDFIIPYYPIELQIQDFVWIFVLIMAISFFAALYPVRVFTKVDLVH